MGAVEVWRVEDDRRRGPYGVRASVLPEAGCPDAPWHVKVANAAGCAYRPESHPLPWDDDLAGAVEAGCRFGFRSREAAEAWFGRAVLDRMCAWGFRLRRLSVPGDLVWCGRSGRQVAFRRELAEELEVEVVFNPQSKRSESWTEAICTT